MNYEKKYKEALERAEKALEVFGTDKCEGARQIFSLFPELKESEDEKIRKDILCYFEHYAHDIKGADLQKWIAWLEKQGEQEEPQVYETGDAEKKELKKLGQSEVTKTSDQEEIAEIPFGAKDSELQEATYHIPKGFYAEIDDDKVVIKKGEKPAAWSKKDEKMFEYALNMIEWYSGKNEDKSRFVSDWLKSIKQRIGG